MRIVSLAALASIGLVGCNDAETHTNLRPEGPPEVIQVFVLDNDDVSKLAYGEHPDINDLDGDPSTMPEYDAHVGPVNNAFITGNKIRVVVDELLRGGTLEQFACACYYHPTPPFDSGTGPGCSTRGFAFGNNAVDINGCITCQDDPVTQVNETGKCADYNFDDTPDVAYLIGGADDLTTVASITCDGTNIPIPVTRGFYNPTGNQLIPTALGTDAIGPAIVLLPPVLRSDADCTVEIDPTVVDKDGNAITWPDGPLSFHTEAMAVSSTQPQDGAINVPTTTTISIGFTTEIDPQTAGNIIVREMASGTEVLGTAMIAPADPTSIVFTPAAALLPDTVYEIVIPTTVTDVFGGAFPAEEIRTFTTGAT